MKASDYTFTKKVKLTNELTGKVVRADGKAGVVLKHNDGSFMIEVLEDECGWYDEEDIPGGYVSVASNQYWFIGGYGLYIADGQEDNSEELKIGDYVLAKIRGKEYYGYYVGNCHDGTTEEILIETLETGNSDGYCFTNNGATSTTFKRTLPPGYINRCDGRFSWADSVSKVDEPKLSEEALEPATTLSNSTYACGLPPIGWAVEEVEEEDNVPDFYGKSATTGWYLPTGFGTIKKTGRWSRLLNK